MAQKRIIERYGLAERVLALSAAGKKDYEIAEILTREDLAGRDAISQPSVSRWLKGVRQERGKTAKGIVDEYLTERLPADLEILDETMQFHLAIFRGKTAFLEKDGEKVRVAEITLETRRIASRDLLEIIKVKLKAVGVDGEAVKDIQKLLPVELSQYQADVTPHDKPDVEGGENG